MGSYIFATGTREEARNGQLNQVDTLAAGDWIIIPGSNPELKPLVIKDLTHTNQGLTAASDYLFHERFDTELSVVGKHIKAIRDDELFMDEVGMLHINYKGNDVRPSPRIAFMGWMGMDLLNGVLAPKPLRDERTDEEKLQRKQPSNVLAAYKHSYIDAIISGRTLVIFIKHYNRNGNGKSYVEKFIEQWDNPDREAAMEARNNAIQDRTTQVNVVWPLIRDSKKVNGAPVAAPVVDKETGEVEPAAPQELKIAVMGRKTEKNMFDVPAGAYAYAQDGRLVGAEPIPWDPTDEQTIFVWRGIAESGFEVSLKS